MATATLLAQSSETWIYPPQTYTGVDYVYRPKNTWTKNHSNPPKRNNRYQAGNSVSDGNYNGNMMSHFHFSTGGQSMRTFIRNIGGPEKITSIKLRLTCGHSYYSAMNLRVCLGPYWDTSPYHGKTADSYDGLGIKHLTTVSVAKGETKTIDLTAYKSHFSNYETISMYVPGAYNKDYHAYGWVYGHSNSNASNRPELVITYNTNSAPRTPGITVNTATDGYGYIKPNLDVTVVSNGDPDNNLHSSPYALQLRNQSGTLFKEYSWQSSSKFTHDLTAYRGQSVSIRALIRDTEGLMSYSDKTVYVNSKPYWKNYGAEANAVTFSTGVINGVYKQNITLTWPKAVDDQSQHNSNMKYDIFYHIGTDKGAATDMTYSNSLVRGHATNSYTLDATTLGGITINKGERIFFSVWASDSCEVSDYRIVSSWIYREQPPSSPTNVTPTSGHFEDSVKVSWAASSSSNGSFVEMYRVGLMDNTDSIIKSYNVSGTSFTCNDISSIGRGETFKFSVVAVDNLGNDSGVAYSGTLKRNSAPTAPKNFKVNASSIYVKNTVPLVWTAATDADGDAIKYNIYYSINNGLFQNLVKGLSTTSYTHNISALSPGNTINYYIEAYDTFNVYSSKTYIASQPQVNVPSSSPSILLPYSNRVLYTNVPRIIFRTGTSYNGQSLKVIITVNGKEYSSDKDISYFNKSAYGNNEEGMFVVPDSTPLNYSSNNVVSIKCYDGIDYSDSVSTKLSCDALTVSIKNTGDAIKASDFNSLKAMINANRFAYGLSEYSWQDGFLQANKHSVSKKYFEQAIEGIYELTTYLNNKTSTATLKRIYTKDVIATNAIISKNIFNNMCNMVKKS